MSFQYDRYLERHKADVCKGFEWISKNLPWLLDGCGGDVAYQVCVAHDASKYETEEYDAYDNYFYGRNRSHQVVEYFNKAWLHHIHNNPHHWQHWILINDDPKLGNTYIEMPRKYVIEMICDWWAFSWATDNLYEIFNWYEEHKDNIKLHRNTRKMVEGFLNQIKEELLKQDGGLTE